MEISVIKQNGQEVNLKDAKGRELLGTKQNKLIAGNGIKIENNVISVTGGAGGWKHFTINDCTLEEYSGCSYVYNITFMYKGNPGLAKGKNLGGILTSAWGIDNEYVANIFDKQNYHSYDTVLVGGDYVEPYADDINSALDSEPETQDDYLLIGPYSTEFTEAALSDDWGSIYHAKGEINKIGAYKAISYDGEYTDYKKPCLIYIGDFSDEIYNDLFDGETTEERKKILLTPNSNDSMFTVALAKVFE